MTGASFPPLIVMGGWDVGLVMNAWDVYGRKPIGVLDDLAALLDARLARTAP